MPRVREILRTSERPIHHHVLCTKDYCRGTILAPNNIEVAYDGVILMLKGVSLNAEESPITIKRTCRWTRAMARLSGKSCAFLEQCGATLLHGSGRLASGAGRRRK